MAEQTEWKNEVAHEINKKLLEEFDLETSSHILSKAYNKIRKKIKEKKLKDATKI